MTTHVTTFYSFKGGVGRTTLLVNAAHVLAGRGERVLVWDLDLEAPGVHYFPGLGPTEQLWQSGFLEWLGDTPPCPTSEPTAAWPSDAWLNTLGDRVYAASGGHRGTILVLPALGTRANLGNRYAAVDWNSLFVDHPEHGLHLLYRARDALIARFEPTFLFIDARTGVSDLGGFLTRYLPDCTVLVGNYSTQSTEGLRSVYLALDRFATERAQSDPYRHGKLERLLVASPVPVSLPLRERGRERWSRGFPGVAPRTLFEIPLIENLLYAEDVMVRTAPSSDAARAYQSVAERLIELRASHVRSDANDLADVDQPTRLANVEKLLQLLGFETRRSDHADLVARERTPLGERLHLVTYLSGTARADPALRDILDSLRRPLEPLQGQPLLIADTAHDDARRIAEAAGITLRTIRELENQLVDFRAYIAVLRSMFEDSELARTYVPPMVATHGGTSDALTVTMRWVTGHGPPLLVLIGEAGSGKTSFLRRLAYELATQRDANPSLPVPLLIGLDQAGPNDSIGTLAQQHLHATIGWSGNPAAILHLLHAGRLVLLFDDLEDSSTTPQIGIQRFLRRFARSTTARGPATANRMLMTTRSHLSPEAGSAVGQQNAQVVEFVPFEKTQIAMFLEYKLGAARAKAALARILGAPTLASLASQPQLLQLLAEVIVDADDTVEQATAGSLYDRYVARWIDAPNLVLQPNERAQVLEHLAAESWQTAGGKVSGELLLGALRDTVVTLDQLDLELRKAPFLTRSAEHEYQFSHRSFLEYFLARHLARCIFTGGETLGNALAIKRLTPSCTAFLVELVTGKPESLKAIEAVARGPYIDYASENALQIDAAFRANPRLPAPG